MASSSSHVINSEALIRLRYYYVVVTFGKEVIFQIFNYCFLHGTTKSVQKILKDNSIPTGKRSNFNKDEVKRLSKNPPETLDISLIYKICESLWEKNVNDPGESLRKLLKNIKDERNNLSHNEHKYSESDLKNKLTEFNKTVQDALDEAKTLYPVNIVDIDNLKDKIQETISKVTDKIREKYDATNQDDIKKLKEEIEAFGDKLHEYIQEKAKEELTSVYEVLCRIMPFDWLIQFSPTYPCNFTISLKMDTEKEFHWGLATKDVITLDQKDILQAKDPDGNDPKVIILSGEAGSGKTTLLSSIVEKWNKSVYDMPNLSSFQILLYMQFRKHDHDNFDEYLRDMLQHTVSNFNFELVKSSILQSECLILCDGYDEANPSSAKLFGDILKLKMPRMKIIVTTRQASTDELTRKVNRSKHHRINLSILGLQMEDMESLISTLIAYLKKDKSDRDETNKKMNKLLKTVRPNMRQLLSTPLWFNMFFLLQIECPDAMKEVTCMTNFYLHMKKQGDKRLEEKLEITGDAIASFDKEYAKWALIYYLQRKYELSQDNISVFKSKCKELGLEFDQIMSSYFTVKYSRKNLDVEKIYCYRHRTEQEFNAALAICNEITELDTDNKSQKSIKENIIVHAMRSILDLQTMKEFDQSKYSPMRINLASHYILPFITGILYSNNRNQFISVFDDILGFFEPLLRDLYCHLNETGNDNYVTCRVKKEIIRFKDDDVFWFEVADNLTLSYLTSMLPELTPCAILISLSDDDLEDPSHLTRTIDIANLHKIELSLLSRHLESFSLEKYLEKAKTCIRYTGRLSRTGIEAIPTGMRKLNIGVNLTDMGKLSSQLEDVKGLDELGLTLLDDGSTDLGALSLSPLPFQYGRFSVFLKIEYDVNLRLNTQRIAKLLSGFWPREKGSVFSKSLYIHSKKSSFLGDTVKLLLEELNIQPVEYIKLRTVEVTEDIAKELISFCSSNGLGELSILGKT